jgi:putative oxidoreductase
MQSYPVTVEFTNLTGIIMNTSAYLGVALLRVGLGVMWISHAMLKLLVFTLPGTAQFFASVGFPGFLAYPAFAVEILGGIALVLGIYARQVALALVPVMAAAASVHIHNGWVFTSTGGGWNTRCSSSSPRSRCGCSVTAPPPSSAAPSSCRPEPHHEHAAPPRLSRALPVRAARA